MLMLRSTDFVISLVSVDDTGKIKQLKLTAYNWQKWKYIPYMSCHEIYKVEAVGLKSYNYM